MSEIWRQIVEHRPLVECLPFLMVKHGNGIKLNLSEVVRTIITAGIIALVVGYGTVRVIEKEQEWMKVALNRIDEKIDKLVPEVQAITSERSVRKVEIDRRLDRLENKK